MLSISLFCASLLSIDSFTMIPRDTPHPFLHPAHAYARAWHKEASKSSSVRIRSKVDCTLSPLYPLYAYRLCWTRTDDAFRLHHSTSHLIA